MIQGHSKIGKGAFQNIQAGIQTDIFEKGAFQKLIPTDSSQYPVRF